MDDNQTDRSTETGQTPDGSAQESVRWSRRGVLKSTAALGVAGVGAGLFFGASGPAAAATTTPRDAAAHAATGTEPVVAHVLDPRSGMVELFVGEHRTQVHDPALVAALTKAATAN